MTTFWTNHDFDVFTIDGLDNRMQALQQVVQPKFAQLGEQFATFFSAHGAGEFYPHIARHARRTVHPPTDSWVAFSPEKRGYKAWTHFQIGLWHTHIFIILAVIYENPNKPVIAERLTNQISLLHALPADFHFSGDHKKPQALTMQELGQEGLNTLLHRLKTVKKAELLIGRQLQREDAVQLSYEQFRQYAENTFNHLLPIYDCLTKR